jgi:putative membrane protein
MLSTASNEKPLAFVVIALVAAMAAYASEPTNGDIALVNAAVQGNLGDTELGKLAVDRGNSTAIRRFAAKMVSDNAANNARLSAIAQRENISVPMDPDAAHVALSKDLANLQGTQFDRRYVQAVQADQHKTLAMLEAAQTDVRDERLKAFIKETLPVAREHARVADGLALE